MVETIPQETPRTVPDKDKGAAVRAFCEGELAQLELIRAPWDTMCKDVRDYLFPYGGRYDDSEVNQKRDRTQLIIDSCASRANQMLSSGMMSYGTSRARPWFALTLRDKRLAKRPAVKNWLFESAEILRDILLGSNTYSALQKSYDELGPFGMSCTLMMPNFENVLWFHPVTNGRYYVASNALGIVDTCYIKKSMSLAQIGEQFPGAELPTNLKSDLQRKQNLHQRHDVVHAIYPRRERAAGRRDNANKAWASVHYLRAGQATDGLLRESGFDTFPILAPRWNRTGDDDYGDGPGFMALGHVKQLQQEQFRKAEAIDQMSNPARQGPPSLKEKDVNGEPGGFTPVDLGSPQAKVQNLVDVRLDLSHLQLDIVDLRQQIDECFFRPAFSVFTNSTTDRQTNDEIRAKMEEKMVMLGAVTSNLDTEQNDPLIQYAFEQAWAGGALPPVPEELAGEAILIEYVSPLAQAQKAIGANSMDRFTSYVGVIASARPEAWDTFNTDTAIERYADKLSIDPDLIVPGPQRALIRQARARAQAAADQAELMNTQADTGQKLANTPIGAGQPTALDAIARLTGVGGAA